MGVINTAGTERQDFSRQFVARVMCDLLNAAERNAVRLKSLNRWDDLKQLRLDGLRDVAEQTEDCGLHVLSDLAFSMGMSVEFELLEPEEARLVGAVREQTRKDRPTSPP